MLLKEVIIAANAAQLAQKGAELFYQTTQESIERQGRLVVAISGGSTPSPGSRHIFFGLMSAWSQLTILPATMATQK
jgi:6-phosphogluconolactonase/glucosamine-6-phosphate isomerase/deaminase